MKKMIVLFAVSLITVGLSFANDGAEPGQEVLSQFKKEFSSAESVKWDKQDEFDKATFVLGGRRVVAYFNEQGQLEGSVRDLFFDQLPLAVMSAVDKRFADYVVLDVREITNSDGTNYRLTIETKNRRYKIKISPSGSVNEMEKVKK